MANTGTKTVLTLRKYVDGAPTGETKANVFGDPDYIAPYEDLVDCPTGAAPTTSPPTTAPPTTSTTTTTTAAPSGTCRNIFVENTVDTGRYGARWINPTNGLTESVFGNLFGTPTTIGGDAGVVYSVCGTSLALTWDSVTNTLVTISGVTELAQGGVCTLDTGCEYIPETTTTAPPVTYYTLTKCEDNGTQTPGFRSTRNTTQVSFNINDRVYNASLNYTFIVTGTTTNDTFGGVGVEPTGFTGCPPAYNYYFARECTDGARITDGVLGDQVIRSINDLSSWSHILIPRFPGDTNAIFNIYSTTTKANYDSNAGDYNSVDVDAISGVAERTSC